MSDFKLKQKLTLDVDSGAIYVLTKTFADKYGKRTDLVESDVWFLPLDPGNYNVRVKIPDSWQDDEINEKFQVTIGQDDGIYVGDACYLIEDWDRFLDDTDCGEEIPDSFGISLGTGGDGEFEVELTISKVEG